MPDGVTGDLILQATGKWWRLLRLIVARCLPARAIARVALLVLATWVFGDTGQAKAAILSQEDILFYRESLKAGGRGDWRKALDLANQASDRRLREVIYWSYYRDTRSGARFEDIANFIAQHRHWPGKGALILAGELAIHEVAEDVRVLAWFAEYRPKSMSGAERFAKALTHQGKGNKAAGILRRAWIELDFNKRDEARFLQRHGRYLNPAIQDARFERLVDERKNRQISRQLKRVSPSIRNLHALRRQLRKGRASAPAKIDKLPRHLRHHEGLLLDLVDFHMKRKEHDKALAVFRDLPKRLARPEYWAKRRVRLARLALREGAARMARDVVSNHGLSKGVEYDRCEFFAGWLAYRFLGDYKLAYRHFTSLYRGVTTSISLSRAAYWAGRVAESAGESRLAKDWYRVAGERAATFYGQLSREKLAGHNISAIGQTIRVTPAMVRRFQDHDLVAIIRRLHEVDTKRIIPFFARLSLDFQEVGMLAQLIGLAHELRRPELALRVARKIQARGTVLVDQSYPVRSLPKLKTGSRPEPALVLAVVRQESAFNASAISSSGARGLMQLMPATARTMARVLREKYRKSRLLRDPDFNLRLGQAYLARLLARYDGSYLLALAAYNAGPTRVDGWVDIYGDPRNPRIDPVDWIEVLPFNETRNYVKRVLEAMQPYRERLAGRPVGAGRERYFSLRN